MEFKINYGNRGETELAIIPGTGLMEVLGISDSREHQAVGGGSNFGADV